MKLLSLLAVGGLASALPTLQVEPVLVAGRELTPTADSIRAAAAMPLYPFNVSAQAGTSDMVGYVEFSASVTEHCEENDGTVQLNADGTFYEPGTYSSFSYAGGQVAYMFNVGTTVRLQVGPYVFFNSMLHFKYSDCQFDAYLYNDGGCGSCVHTDWSSASTNCAMNPSASRTMLVTCRVQVARRESAEANTVQVAGRDTDSDLAVASGSVTAVALTHDTQARDTPELAVSTKGVEIATFHFRLVEYCEGPNKDYKGTFRSAFGNADFNFPPGQQYGLNIGSENAYGTIVLGPVDPNTARLRYYYQHQNGPLNCEWFDDENWKQCGECREGSWSGPPMDCHAENPARAERFREMDCSFILYKH